MITMMISTNSWLEMIYEKQKSNWLLGTEVDYNCPYKTYFFAIFVDSFRILSESFDCGEIKSCYGH